MTLLLATLLLAACGGAPPRKVTFTRAKAEPAYQRYARALRLAARGRVQARAGLDGEASESLRLSYGIEPDLGVLTDHAEAAERAHFFGQAHAAWRELLRHPLDPETRKKAEAEAERLAPLVPADHVPVLITVSPAHAKVTLERSADSRRRVVLSDGVVWLKAGGWEAATVAAGYKGELRAFRVGRRGSQAFAVVLEPSRAAARMAGLRGAARPGGVTPKAGHHPNEGLDAPAEKSTAKASVQGHGTAKTTGDGDAAKDGQDRHNAAQADRADPADGDGADGGGETGDGAVGSAFADGVTQPQPGGSGDNGGGLATWGPIVTAGLGVAALGAGGYFGFNAKQNVDVANGLDPTRPDYKSLLQTYGDDAMARARLANTLFIAGGALAAAGTVWWLLAPNRGERAARSGATSLRGGLASAPSLLPSAMSLTGRGFVALWNF